MTAQAVYEKGVKAIIAQGRASVDDRDNCMYRGKDGCKCLAGHLIPDDMAVERRNVYALPGAKAWFGEHLTLVRNLQRAHDQASCQDPADFVAVFKKLTRAVALRHGLDPACTRA